MSGISKRLDKLEGVDGRNVIYAFLPPGLSEKARAKFIAAEAQRRGVDAGDLNLVFWLEPSDS